MNEIECSDQDITNAHRLWRAATGSELYAPAVLPLARVLALHRQEFLSERELLDLRNAVGAWLGTYTGAFPAHIEARMRELLAKLIRATPGEQEEQLTPPPRP